MHTLFAAPTRAVLLKVGVTNAAAHVVLGLGISFVGPIVAAWVMKKTKYLEFFLYPNKVIKATVENGGLFRSMCCLKSMREFWKRRRS